MDVSQISSRFKGTIKVLLQYGRSLSRSNRDIFDSIYTHQRWGSSAESPDLYSSGSGSDVASAAGYVDMVADYVNANGCQSIVDVGCGDFRVASRILAKISDRVTYVGVDVSDVIIQRNTKMFANGRVSFITADAAVDALPAGDLVLIREVLQHLSNRDVMKIIGAIGQYGRNIVTNTVALGATARNIDIPSGSNSRAGLGSGLWLDQPPFSLALEELGRWRHHERPTELVSVRVVGRATAAGRAAASPA